LATCVQRFPFGLSRLILQYILYNKDKNHASIFICGKTIDSKRANFSASTKTRSISIENRKNTKWQNRTATTQKENAVWAGFGKRGDLSW
jgi:hypothetical protein